MITFHKDLRSFRLCWRRHRATLISFLVSFLTMSFACAMLVGFLTQKEEGLRTLAQEFSPEHPKASLAGFITADFTVFGAAAWAMLRLI